MIKTVNDWVLESCFTGQKVIFIFFVLHTRERRFTLFLKGESFVIEPKVKFHGTYLTNVNKMGLTFV